MQEYLGMFGGSNSIDLEEMGKTASKMFLHEDISLHDAVVKLAQAQSDMTSEQVRRVVESANRNTFLFGFQKEAQKTIEFEIAEPKAVLSTLNLLATPVVKTAACSDYSRELPNFESKEEDRVLEELFSYNPEKIAADCDDDGLSNFETLRAGLQHVVGDLDDGIRGNGILLKQAQSDFHTKTSQYLGNGCDVSDVVNLVSAYAPKYAHAVLSDLGEHLDQSLEASRQPKKLANFEDPLVRSFCGYITALEKQAELLFARQDSEDRLRRMDEVYGELQKKSSVAKTLLNGVLNAPKTIATGLGASSMATAGALQGRTAGDPSAKNPLRRGNV